MMVAVAVCPSYRMVRQDFVAVLKLSEGRDAVLLRIVTVSVDNNQGGLTEIDSRNGVRPSCGKIRVSTPA